MMSAGKALEADHHEIDRLFATFITSTAGAGSVDQESLTEAIRKLRLHIWIEEEIFFPPLKAAGAVGPVMVMHREHGEIWRGLDNLERIVAGEEPDLEAVLFAWGPLNQTLTEHNYKEEKILYASADRILEPSVSRKVNNALIASLPEGWVCEMADR